VETIRECHKKATAVKKGDKREDIENDGPGRRRNRRWMDGTIWTKKVSTN